jgi:hypothetical protein
LFNWCTTAASSFMILDTSYGDDSMDINNWLIVRVDFISHHKDDVCLYES